MAGERGRLKEETAAIDLSEVRDHREARLLIVCAMLLSSRVPDEFWQKAKELKERNGISGFFEQKTHVGKACGL